MREAKESEKEAIRARDEVGAGRTLLVARARQQAAIAELSQLASFTPIRSMSVFGGVPIG